MSRLDGAVAEPGGVGIYLDDGAVACSLCQCRTILSESEQLTSSFKDLTRALSAIGQSQGDNLVVSREFDLSTTCISFLALLLMSSGYAHCRE